MARNKEQLLFEIDGDSSGLRKALAEGGNSLTKFGTESDELFGGLAGKFTDITGRLQGFSGGLMGTAGALGLAAGGIYSLVTASNEYVKQYNEVANTSSLTVEQLQKLQKQFQGTGFTIEKFGDLNRDALDHLADAFRDGSGPAEDMKAYGINLQNFNKYLNMSDGGIRAVAESFYEMRKAGKSTAEITNMLETLGSDGSKLIGVFNQYGNTMDLMNAIQSQHAILTDETAKKYADFDKQVNDLSSSFQLWRAQALAPTLTDIQTLFDWMNKDWKSTDFMEMFHNFYYGGDNAIAKVLRQIDGVDPRTVFGTKEWNDAHRDNQFPPKPEAQAAPKGGWENLEKKKAEADAAAKKAAAEAKARAAKVAQAQIQWDTLVSKSGVSSGEIRLKEFNRQQDEIMKKIQDTGKVLGKDQRDIDSALSTATATRQRQLSEMVDEMIGISDTNKDLRDMSQNIAAVHDQLNAVQASKLMIQQNQRLGLQNTGNDADNPWNNANVLDQKRKDLEEQQNLELTMNEQLSRKLNLSQEQYQARKKAIQQKYNQQALAIETDNTKAQMGVLSDAAGSLGTILSGAFSSGSKEAEAAFAIQKGLSIAQTVLSIQQALAGALATPWPSNLANYAQILSMGASIITTAKGAASGKAHSGIDEVPNIDGSSDSTWILKAGERVVQPEANKKLTQFLDNQNGSSNSKSNNDGGFVVNAPLVIQGGNTNDDAKFQSMLRKHQNSVVQAVKNAQSRTT